MLYSLTTFWIENKVSGLKCFSITIPSSFLFTRKRREYLFPKGVLIYQEKTIHRNNCFLGDCDWGVGTFLKMSTWELLFKGVFNCSNTRIIETITSRTSSGTSGAFKIPRSGNLCLSHLEQYIEKTKDLLKDQNLLIRFVKPHKHIITSTISWWCVTVLKNVGMDETVFESDLTRSTWTEHYKNKGILWKTQLKQLDDHLLRRLQNITINGLSMRVEVFPKLY